MDERPGCNAVEFWEKYNYACFECTDLAKVTSYPYERDLAYPVYVWVKGKNKMKNGRTRTSQVNHDCFCKQYYCMTGSVSH